MPICDNVSLSCPCHYDKCPIVHMTTVTCPPVLSYLSMSFVHVVHVSCPIVTWTILICPPCCLPVMSMCHLSCPYCPYVLSTCPVLSCPPCPMCPVYLFYGPLREKKIEEIKIFLKKLLKNSEVLLTFSTKYAIILLN